MIKVLFLLLIMNISIFSKTLNTAVILENNDEMSNTYLNILKDELTKNFAGTNFQPNILKVLYVDNQNLENQLNSINLDNKIDSLFILTDTSIDKIKNLNKNKFYSAPLGFGKNLEKLPNNLNYVYSDLDLKNYLQIFNNVNGVNEIDIFISNISEANITNLSKNININNLKINIYKADEKKIKESKNPIFLISFNENFNKYAYVGIDMKKEFSKRIRAASLNYMLYKTNNRLGKVVEVNEPRENIFFNGDVANKLGLYPNLIFLQNISNLKISEKDRIKLTLKNAVERALNSNFSLLKSKQDLETSSYNVKISNSSRLPQLNANMQYNAIDKRTSNFKMGAPTNSVNSYLELSQVIFNDQLNASVQIEKLALDSSRKQYEQTKLNILYYTASTYVNILQLNAQLDIQKSNYALLKESLEIAKLNYKVGAGGLQDVYRLESDVASSLANIANIGSEIKNQEIYLNTLLNLPPDNSYNYESLKDVSTYFVLSDSFNKNFSYGSDRSKKIENFLVQGAISNSNSLASLNNNIKAKERELSANKRERFLPKVSAAGKYYKDNMITPWGENSNKKFPDEYWEAGIVATLPLISGGEIYYNSKKIESEIQSLEYSWADSKNNLVQQVLQTYTELLSNYVQNYSTSTSATVAKKNLDIVRNLYSEGTITVTDLLSAQNNALSQELNNVIQNFNLINSALKLENLYGKSSITMTSDEKLQILNNLNEVLEK